MKTVLILIILSIGCQIGLMAQTPEQQKQKEEAKRKMDSIMNLPHIKAIMKEAKAQEVEFEKLEKKRKADEKLKPKAKKEVKPKPTKNGKDSFYWQNTIASNTSGQFSNWSYGSASIRVGLYDRNIRGYIYVPFGTISKEGQINIQLPSIEEDKLPFKTITTPYGEGETTFYFGHLNYSNSKVEWLSTRFSLQVHQGEKVLGYLKMGNTIKPVVNLNSPCCTGKAGDGYAISWVYVTDATKVDGETDSKTGGKIVHDMNIKQGWNLIKIEVSGEDEFNRWKNKKHTTLSSLPTNTKYYFMKHLD